MGDTPRELIVPYASAKINNAREVGMGICPSLPRCQTKVGDVEPNNKDAQGCCEEGARASKPHEAEISVGGEVSISGQHRL